MTENADKKREQIHLLCMDEMVPKDHLLRIIDKAIDWTFIYDLVKDKYSHDTGRPSMDPVTLIKIPLIQYLYGIKSMRQTVKEIEVNVAYRWFLGLDMTDKVPHFSTFRKNYTRRFKDTDLFEQIFAHILEECYKFKLVKGLYDKIKNIGIKTLVADAGYKTPAIAKLLIDDGVTPLCLQSEACFKALQYFF